MPYVPPHLLDGSLFRQSAPPPGLFDILQPGMLRMGGGQLFNPMGAAEGPGAGLQGGTANPAGSAGGIGGMTNSASAASNPASGLSQPATAANVANAALGLVGALSPTGMMGLVGNAVAGKSPADSAVGKSVTGLLGMLGLDTGSNATGPSAAEVSATSDATGLGLGVDSTSTSAGGDGGGGSKVICSYLMRNGLLDRDLYLAAHDGFYIPPHVKRGYLVWAVHVVELLRCHPWAARFVAPLCRAWSGHVAHVRFPESYPRHLPGLLLHGLGWGLCALIGKRLSEPAHGTV